MRETVGETLILCRRGTATIGDDINGGSFSIRHLVHDYVAGVSLRIVLADAQVSIIRDVVTGCALVALQTVLGINAVVTKVRGAQATRLIGTFSGGQSFDFRFAATNRSQTNWRGIEVGS